MQGQIDRIVWQGWQALPCSVFNVCLNLERRGLSYPRAAWTMHISVHQELSNIQYMKIELAGHVSISWNAVVLSSYPSWNSHCRAIIYLTYKHCGCVSNPCMWFGSTHSERSHFDMCWNVGAKLFHMTVTGKKALILDAACWKVQSFLMRCEHEALLSLLVYGAHSVFYHCWQQNDWGEGWERFIKEIFKSEDCISG